MAPPLIVKAVQDIARLSDTFRQTLIAWLADATNGITKLFAAEVDTQKLCITKSDGTPVCVTGDAPASGYIAARGSAGGWPLRPCRMGRDAGRSEKEFCSPEQFVN